MNEESRRRTQALEESLGIERGDDGEIVTTREDCKPTKTDLKKRLLSYADVVDAATAGVWKTSGPVGDLSESIYAYVVDPTDPEEEVGPPVAFLPNRNKEVDATAIVTARNESPGLAREAAQRIEELEARVGKLERKIVATTESMQGAKIICKQCGESTTDLREYPYIHKKTCVWRREILVEALEK